MTKNERIQTALAFLQKKGYGQIDHVEDAGRKELR